MVDVRNLVAFLALAGIGLVLGACAQELPEHAPPTETIAQEAAIAGPWQLSDELRAIGEAQFVPYDGAPAWDGGANCGGAFHPGTRELADYLAANFDGTRGYGGYACRQNTASPTRTSVHGTGRAIDLFIELDGGQADNGFGDPVAEYLIRNAEAIGVQYIIWDRWQWSGSRSGRKDREYGGPHPHHDHLHIELTIDAAERRTPWFTERCSEGGCDIEDDGTEPCDPEAIAGNEGALFEDVLPDSLGAEQIAAFWRAGITNGCSDDPRLFCPDCPALRYQFVVFLLRAAGIEPRPVGATPMFDDVPEDVWWRRWVEEAAHQGITTGCGGDSFCPLDEVTRGQAAAFIVRTLGWPNENPATPTFDDVPTDHLFYRSIETLSQWCITNGCNSEGTEYCPDSVVDRRVAAIFIARAFDLEGANRCVEYCDVASCERLSYCEEWTACDGFSGSCGESGTQSRVCHTFACNTGSQIESCEESTSTETRDCTRDSDGVVLVDWSGWSMCVDGEQSRSRSECSSGDIVNVDETRTCGGDAGDADTGDADTGDADTGDADVGPDNDMGTGEDSGTQDDTGNDDVSTGDDADADDTGADDDVSTGDEDASSGDATTTDTDLDDVDAAGDTESEPEEPERPAVGSSGCSVSGSSNGTSVGWALLVVVGALLGRRTRRA